MLDFARFLAGKKNDEAAETEEDNVDEAHWEHTAAISLFMWYIREVDSSSASRTRIDKILYERVPTLPPNSKSRQLARTSANEPPR